MNRTGLRRLGIAAAAASTLLLAACGGSSAGTSQAGSHQKVTLTWWTWTANPKDVIKNFEAKYPWIKIPTPPSYGSGGTFYSKLTTALAASNGPCVSQVELDHLPQFTQAHDLVNIAQYDAKYSDRLPELGVAPGVPGQRPVRDARGHRPHGPDVPAQRAEEVPPAGAHDLGHLRLGRGRAAQGGPVAVPDLLPGQRRGLPGGPVLAGRGAARTS